MSAGTGWTVDVSPREELARSDLGTLLGPAQRCLLRSAFDAKANGFGSLQLLVDRANEIREARYLGFDAAPALERGFRPEDLARKQRATFDELGMCLREGALGVHVGGPRRTEPASVAVWFTPGSAR